MPDINFVFFHVGDVEQPRLLVKSIRKFNPGSNIYFITDSATEIIVGVTDTLRIISDSKKYDMGYIDESVICTLPEFATTQETSYSVHFKGEKRKKLMLKAAEFMLSDKPKILSS